MEGQVRAARLMRPGYAVCQLGARMHYAVPRILHRHGLLNILYTDICAQKGWPRLLSLIPCAMRPSAVQRVIERVVPDVPAGNIVAFNAFGIEYARRRARARSAAETDEIYLWAGQRFCELTLNAGLEAEAIYTFNTAGLELLRFARTRGIRTVMEQTIAPRFSELRLLAHEREVHPGWEPPCDDSPAAHALAQRERDEWSAADLILCASPFVRDEIAAAGGPAERCAIVPYGVDPEFAPNLPRDHDGPIRVLTVGAVGLRKGSPYVLAAAKSLEREAQFRLVGAASLSSEGMGELKRYVELRGAVPRSQMREHFAWADVFLLPSICEGSATATYEALASGLPVIATPNTGSVIRDGVDGFIVPCGNAEAIIQKLHLLADSAALLKELSHNARARSLEFRVESYGTRLIEALKIT